ncbi:cytochrome c oxidase subunit II [Noviherbaspirillum suwonense]|jgi:cytochrome c oxidase subunit 2|uniref:Cytochrome aa3 subunit 2 n=1 Tax=Noviherbaspirillum suwonense TaxID=1224511 RepID=A0ABY1Q9K3_9BURK|nr:cytochrome c oxidase subunit II [Noviherbaspirillum suwonense]SMP63663.1 cytochrome c oxidase subunit 2 [Noviherbaspirillum suwonense]
MTARALLPALPAAMLLGGCAQLPSLQSVLHPAGPDAALITGMLWMLCAGSLALFVGVMALLALSLRRGRPVDARWWIAGGGIALPVAVLSALLLYSTWRSAQLSPQGSQDALHISVTARMWWWEVRYRDPASGRDILLANELHIPVGRRVYLGLGSADVIHSFWVPALGGKMDTIPGRINGLTLQADRPGVYRGQCAEYCGQQHAKMAMHVVAESQQDFDAWLARQAAPAAPIAPVAPNAPVAPDAASASAGNALLERGRAAFFAQRCNACHAIRGVTSPSDDAGDATLGPDLTHVGSRLYLAAGVLPNHSGAMAGWIAGVQAVKPGARMPSFERLDGATLSALAAYLEHLK